ncbi:MAG: choice-of-anchor Q domain-containing protein, partial [Dongiaceae bacterium]
TILAGNTVTFGSRPDLSGSLASLGHNLIGNTSGGSGFHATDLLNVNPLLGPLQDNGGPTLTHALLAGSPAIEAGNPALPGSGGNACEAADQRGISRPRGLACDIGAFEVDDPAQTGPVFTVIATVGTNDDVDDGVCSFAHCSLREAIHAANARPNGAAPDEIHFNLTGVSPFTLMLTSALPTITGPVIIDGTTQPGGTVTLDGSSAGASADCLTISGGNSTVRGLVIRRCAGNGILLTTNGDNLVEDNTITLNGAAGVRVTSGAGNEIRSNLIFANGGLGIDLGGDGVTPNDTGDPDTGANNLQNFPVVIRAIPGSGSTTIEGRLNSAANTTFTLEFFANATCDPAGFGEGETLLGSTSVTTDSRGDASFQTTVPSAAQFVSATATDANGNTSEFSQCVRVGPGNDAWTSA